MTPKNKNKLQESLAKIDFKDFDATAFQYKGSVIPKGRKKGRYAGTSQESIDKIEFIAEKEEPSP